MQLGIVSSILYDLELPQVFEVAAELQFDCVELMCWPAGDHPYGGVSHLDVTNFMEADVQRVRRLCDDYAVSISALGYYPNFLAVDSQEAEFARGHLLKVIDAAKLLDVNRVTTFIGANPTLPLAKNMEAFAHLWPPIVNYAEKQQVRLAIENCPMLFEDHGWPFGANLARSPRIMQMMFEVIDSDYFGLNFDPSHFVRQMMNYEKPLFHFSEKIFHTHAKDTRNDYDLLDWRGIFDFGWSTAKTPGLGDIQWGRWISALTEIGYDGPVCVEIEDEAFSGPLEKRKQALQISYNVLRPLVV